MKYLHLRALNNGEVLVKGGLTVAYEEPKAGENVIKVAIAYCSTRDNFSRKVGRAVATGRFTTAFVNGEPTKHVRMIPLFNQKPIEAIIANVI